MMRNLRWYPVLLGGLLLGTAPAQGTEPTPLPDTPVGKQTQRLLDSLGSGNPERIKAFIEANFARSFLEAIPLDKHTDINSRFARETGDVVLREIVTASKTNLRLLVVARKTETTYLIAIEVEADPPHKITSLGIGRPEPWALVKPPAIPEGPLSHAQVAAWLQDYLDRLCRADAFSGTVLVAQREQVVFAKACGLASRAWSQPNRLDTKFNLGSMNKMFTSVAIAQLVEKGRVSLDGTIGKYLPNRDAAQKVTVRHLLTHTSGLADYFNAKFMNASRTRFRTIADYFSLFADNPLQFEPGTRYNYSNAGFMVLGAIVQEVSGVDYFEYVRLHIYKPAGMVNTDAYELDTDVPNLAVGYTRGTRSKTGVPTVRNNLFLHVIKGGPAGGGYSTVEDLQRFANALRNGKLIKPETLRQWTSPSDKEPGYAFGFAVYQASQPKVIGHGGGFPGVSSALLVPPQA